MASDHKADEKARTLYEEQAARAKAEKDAAIAAASKEDPAEKEVRDHAMAVNRWKRGIDADGNKKPFDIRDNPDDIVMGLFNESMKTHDAGRGGTGYGSLDSNANPNFSAALDKENELKRRLASSAALEENIDAEFANNDSEMFNLANMGNQRNQFIAGIQSGASENAYSRQLQQYMKQKKPSFMDTLGSSFANRFGNTLGGGSFGTGGEG